jgi:LEA14-like dessication related protein|tara:strand:- start:145 stop:633 length:489 start_codon:yes stop_codon:yes gene_type:complete
MGLQSRLTVYAAIVGCLGLMAGIVYYASLDNVSLEQVEVELTDVTLRVSGENEAKFTLTFLVKNSSEKTFVVPVIEYQLYGDDVLLGSGKYSTEDVALPGRAQIFGGSEVPLKNTFILNKSEVGSEIYQSMINNEITNFVAEGMIITQSTWSVAETEFRTEK